MITPPPIADLASISIAGASLESALQRWIDESTRGHYTLNVPILTEAVDLYTRLVAVRKTIIKLFRLIPSREPWPDAPPFDDLAALSAAGAEIERAVMHWAQEIERVPNPDVPTLAEAIDIYTRVASARKILIKLSSPTAPRPNRPNQSSRKSNPSDPVPSSDIPQLPNIPDIPYDRLRPELDFVAAALDQISPSISRDQGSDRSDRSDRSSDPSASSDPRAAQAPDASEAPQALSAQPDTVAAPAAEETLHNSHDSHDPHSSHESPDVTLGDVNPRFLSPCHDQKFRRYG